MNPQTTIRQEPLEPGQVTPAKRRSPSRVLTILAVVGVVMLGLLAAWALVGFFQPHLYAGTVLQGDYPAPALDELRFVDGEPVDLAAFDDEVVLIFFGYTNCPDVCPATMSTVSRTVERLNQGQRERTNLLMVSVDPERDDLASLQEYVEFFDPGFRGVGGEPDAIDRAATLYGVFYQLDRDGVDDDDYLVDHTATLMGIGPDGALRVIWGSDISPEDLAADIAELLS